METKELLSRAKNAIQEGNKSLRSAAEDIATAQAQGANQREIAVAVGRSLGWVNRLLKWRDEGYNEDTPFGPSSKASRQRKRVQASKAARQRKRVQATEQAKGEADSESPSKQTQGPEGAKAEARTFDPNARERLIQALEMLASDGPGERASAGRQVEILRSELGLTWHQLIVAPMSDAGALAA